VGPVAAVVESGREASLSALVSGSPEPVFQWRHAGVDLPGATNRVLILENAGLSSIGEYQLVASNSFGSATSAVARVSIAIPLRNATVSDGVFSAAFTPTPGLSYAAQMKKSVRDMFWTRLPDSAVSQSPGLMIDPTPVAPGSQRFYRLIAH
jgi:hypothetical protein